MGNYYSLAASLPVLSFSDPDGAISPDDFMERCRPWLEDEKWLELKRVSLEAACAPAPDPEIGAMWFLAPPDAFGKFRMWDTQFRNELVRRRAGGRGDFVPRYVADMDGDLPAQTARCFEAADPREKAAAVDRLRWNKLESLCALHDSDWDFLCIYKLKTELLAKWRKRTFEKGERDFESVLRAVVSGGGADNIKKE